jgi:hypothetical protein
MANFAQYPPMLPIDRLRLLYAAGIHGHGDSLQADITAHRSTGFIIDSTDAFMMWRMVGLDWTLERMLDPWQFDPGSQCAWIWAIAGDYRSAVEQAMNLCPHARFVAYERRGKPRLHPIGRFIAS